MKKIIWLILAIVLVFGLSACLPGTGGGGGPSGPVYFDGERLDDGPAGGGDAAAAAPAAQGQDAATATAAAPQQTAGFLGDFGFFLPMLGVLAVMYFLMIRPQRKQAKQVKEMQAALGVGDNVMTNTGFFGKIVSVGTDAFMVEFGEGGKSVKVPVRKTDIAGVRTPVMTPPPRGEESTK